MARRALIADIGADDLWAAETPVTFRPDSDGDAVTIDGSEEKVCVHVDSIMQGSYSAFVNGKDIDKMIVALIALRPHMADEIIQFAIDNQYRVKEIAE